MNTIYLFFIFSSLSEFCGRAFGLWHARRQRLHVQARAAARANVGGRRGRAAGCLPLLPPLACWQAVLRLRTAT
jgi:hypothetical protein